MRLTYKIRLCLAIVQLITFAIAIGLSFTATHPDLLATGFLCIAAGVNLLSFVIVYFLTPKQGHAN